MKDELAERRYTLTIKKTSASILEAANYGDENAKNVISDLETLESAISDAKTSLHAFTNDLEDPAVLVIYESKTGENGKCNVLNALFPDHRDLVAEILLGE